MWAVNKVKVWLKHVALVISLPALLAGCQFSEGRRLQREVSESEIVGLWRLTATSAEDIHDEGYEKPIDLCQNTIRLNADHTCHISSLLGWPPFEKVDLACQWKLRTAEKKKGRRESILWLDDDEGRIAWFYFYETRGGELFLWDYIADPDMWRYLEFEKAEVSRR